MFLFQLTRLSLTYNHWFREEDVETLRKCLKRLEFCFLFFPTKLEPYCQKLLNKFLSLMTELRELWCVCRFCVHLFTDEMTFMKEAGFYTNLEKLIVSESGCSQCVYEYQNDIAIHLQIDQKFEHRLVLVDHDKRFNSSLT
ncbi:unnamed protein product, partial [Timema podura]|nr:unnamed protein product [Timema podura]